jgi:hypothetical protein
MGDVEVRKEVFAWFGAAAFYAQCVEVELIIARLALARRGSEPTAEDWQRIETERRTMGALLLFIRKEIPLSDGDLEVLESAVRDRNFLAHDFWYQRSTLLATNSGCENLITELQVMSQRLKAANDAGERVSAMARAAAGIDEEVVQRVQREFRERLARGELADGVVESQISYLQCRRSH